MPKLAALVFAAATMTYSATGQSHFSTSHGGEPRVNVSEECPGFLRDLLTQGQVSWMDMHFECEDDHAPAITVVGKGNFTYYGEWPQACWNPMNTTMKWSRFPTGLFERCNTSSDCKLAGCSAVCAQCYGEDCEHPRICEPEPRWDTWAACVEETVMAVKLDVVERACQDPRDTCRVIWKDQNWDPLGCGIFEQEAGFWPDDRARLIASPCAGYLEEYTHCLERYMYSDPEFFHHMSPGQHIRRNLDAAMPGAARCLTIPTEKAMRIGAMPCVRAPEA